MIGLKREVWFKSFEEYITARQERLSDAKANPEADPNRNRSYATKERRKIEVMTSALGISLELFKKDSSYYMTMGTCELFDCLLDGYGASYGKAIRNNDFSQVPQKYLIRVRALLFDALRDIGVPEKELFAELHFFETRTGASKRILAKDLSEPVAECIAYCRERMEATDEEWDMLSDCVELQYLGEIKPRLTKFLLETISLQLAILRGEEVPSEESTSNNHK